MLREGLDLPEVTLVAILDADKEGFLRSRTSLIQTMGRAARNINSEVIFMQMWITKSIKAAIEEVKRRREIQLAYNKKHNITPVTIEKSISARLIEEFESEEEQMRRKPIDLLLGLSEKDIILPDEKEPSYIKTKKRNERCCKKFGF